MLSSTTDTYTDISPTDSAPDTAALAIFRAALADIIPHIRKPDFLTYFKKFSVVASTPESITFGVASAFHRDNIIAKFYDMLRMSISRISPAVCTLDFVVDEHIETRSPEYVVDCRTEMDTAAKKLKTEQIHGVEVVEGLNSRLINTKYKLDNFIVGPANQLAHAASDAVSRRPGSAYNPLYIYGNVGLGKTHLLQGIGNAIKDRHGADKKVIYTTADRFLTDYVNSVKGRSIDKLRDKYRGIDVLIIDDVQFLAGKKQTQEELYNIFNILYESGKQIVLSGDRPPKELTELEPRLQSRFEWGIIADVGEPDYETRFAILQEKARAREFMLPHDVAEFIAENAKTNVREIEGILNQVIAEYDLRGIFPTLESVAVRFSKLAITSITDSSTYGRSARKATCGFEDLLQAVSSHYGLEIRSLISEDRHRENMLPRQMAMYLLKSKLHYTYERIGNIFSGRNHTAVMYSCKKMETTMKKDQQVVYEMNCIRDKLGI